MNAEIIVTMIVSATMSVSYLECKDLAYKAAEVTAKGWEQRVSTAEAMGYTWAAQARAELEAGKAEQARILASLPEEAES